MEILDPLQKPDWDHLVQAHPHCTVFHSAAWARVLINTYHHRPLYLGYFQGKTALTLLPLMEVKSTLTGTRGVSLPFTDSCLPLAFTGDPWELLLRDLKELCRARGWHHFELRGADSASTHHLEHTEYLEHSLSLNESPDRIFAKFSEATRRAIRKALKSNLRIEIGRAPEALQAYYYLHRKTRKRHGIPPQPQSFFESIGKELIACGNGFIVLAYLGAIPISGAVFFHCGRHSVYKFGASDAAHQEYRANNLVMWSAIQRLLETGITTLHWGRTSRANAGLRKFKLGWGTIEKPLWYLRWQPRRDEWVKAPDHAQGIHNHLFRHLPAGCNAFLGKLMYPHLD